MYKTIFPKSVSGSSHCGARGSMASWEHWDTGLIPSLAKWVKDPALLQPLLRSQPRLGTPYAAGTVKKAKIHSVSGQADAMCPQNKK